MPTGWSRPAPDEAKDLRRIAEAPRLALGSASSLPPGTSHRAMSDQIGNLDRLVTTNQPEQRDAAWNDWPRTHCANIVWRLQRAGHEGKGNSHVTATLYLRGRPGCAV